MRALIAGLAAIAAVQDEPINLDDARRFFQEAKVISDADGGRLWGRALYGPMVFVDPRTRSAVANEAPKSGGFTEEKDIYSGRLPAKIALANYAFDWEGTRWSMVIWPLPSDRAERATLLMHELFHRIQPELGLGGSSPPNAHLETLEGRVWIQLELAALAEALAGPDTSSRRRHSAHALQFRQERQKLAANAKGEEELLEMNEGLAQYTGCMLRGGAEPETRRWLADQLRKAVGLESYTRRFAYSTGSAYGFLLNLEDDARFGEVRWRKAVSPRDSLADRLAEAIGSPKDKLDLDAAAAAYGVADLRRSEEERERRRKEKTAAIRAKFIDGRVLVFPLLKMRNSFRTEDVFAMGPEGTYFAAATLGDDWGKLEVTSEGMLLAADRKSARVIAPKGADVAGPGWKLTLAPGWQVVPGARAGDFTVKGP